MNTLDAIQSRRAIKHFDASHKMNDADREQILSLAMLSPTAFNIQHWRFVVVDDADLRQKLKLAAMGQAQVTDASLFIILCADLNAWQKEPARYYANTSTEVSTMMLANIDSFYRHQPQRQRDEAVRSCGIAAQTIMLAAKSLGYDSCPMGGFDAGQVASLINLPDDHLVTMLIAIGKATQAPWPRAGQLPLDQVVIHDSF